MPVKSVFHGISGPIEVAPNMALRAVLLKGAHRWGPMTSVQLANFCYWGRKPHDHRTGARWWSNASQQSATRRAVAALMADGKLQVVGKVGAAKYYGVAPVEERPRSAAAAGKRAAR